MGPVPTFDNAFKIAVAREYLTGQLSHRQIAKKYNLPSHNTSKYFVLWYRRWLKKKDTDPDAPVLKSNDQTLELERQLRQANLKITALEMMIKIAEEELGIDIVKKSGTKQPRQ